VDRVATDSGQLLAQVLELIFEIEASLAADLVGRHTSE
jgi:hypothetical protein